MRRKRFGFFIYILMFFTIGESSFYGDEDQIVIGGKEGWSSTSHVENIIYSKGLYGFDSLGLMAQPETKNEDYDLFLSFDGDVSKDFLHFYTISSSNAKYVSKDRAKYGSAALICRATPSAPSLVLTPKENAFFFGNAKMTSFTIEFWLCPEDLRAGSTILKWWSQVLEKNVFMFQNIVVSIVENKLEWSLFNIWRDGYNRGIDVILQSKKPLSLEKWSHHLLTYDDETGLLEYRIDGKIDSIRYMTPSGKESPDVFYSMKGKTATVSIGEGYSGLMDNFAVKNSFSPQSFSDLTAKYVRYNKDGHFISDIIDTGGINSIPKMLSVKMDTKKEATIAFFVRSSNTPYNWTDSQPAWHAIKPNIPITNCKQGRFFQIRANLYPAKDGMFSPTLHSMTLTYDKDVFARPPITLIAKEGDGYVDLEWSRSVDFDVKGYLVFFGERSNEYFLSSSPIDAKDALSMRIYHLTNGKLYFFSVVAYDENGKTCPGEFSKEVCIRPMQK